VKHFPENYSATFSGCGAERVVNPERVIQQRIREFWRVSLGSGRNPHCCFRTPCSRSRTREFRVSRQRLMEKPRGLSSPGLPVNSSGLKSSLFYVGSSCATLFVTTLWIWRPESDQTNPAYISNRSEAQPASTTERASSAKHTVSCRSVGDNHARQTPPRADGVFVMDRSPYQHARRVIGPQAK